MRWPSIFVLVFLGAPACSLVYGLYDNHAPLDASVDAPFDTAPPMNGCAADAGPHTFCESFDEATDWPADASMSPDKAHPPLLLDAGCNTPPYCIGYSGDAGFARRTFATPNGVAKIVYDFHARFDAIDAGIVPRIAWIEADVGAEAHEVGVTFSHYGGDNSFDLFSFVTPTTADGTLLMPFTTGTWYHLTLTVDFAGAGLVTLQCESPFNVKSQTFAQLGGSAFDATQVTSVSVFAGVATGSVATAAVIDTITFDLE